jgi:hypothetical protein
MAVVPYFWGGGFTASGVYKPTGSAAGIAALVAAYPTIGNITTIASQFYSLWNGPNDSGGLDGSASVAGGTLYSGTSGFMIIGGGTNTITPGSGGYPVITGPGYYGSGCYWKVGALYCCAPGGVGCAGNIYNLGACASIGQLVMFPPPAIPGYFYDANWAIHAIAGGLSGYPKGSYIGPTTGQVIIPVILNDPGGSSQPASFSATSPVPGTPESGIPGPAGPLAPAPASGSPAFPGTDGTFTSNPPGTINWWLQRCDIKPRAEEKA